MSILTKKSGVVGNKNKSPGLYEEAYQAGVKAERARVAELMGLQRQFPKSEKIVSEAILNGKELVDIEPGFVGAALKAGTYGEEKPEKPSKAQLDAFREKIRKIS